MHAWKSALEKHNLLAAQILLTREDFNQHGRSVKVRETIETLLQQVIPVVNENDSITDEELKFGDNDVLSAFWLPFVGGTLSHSNHCTRVNDIHKFRSFGAICQRNYRRN